MTPPAPSDNQLEQAYQKLKQEAESGGYHFNPEIGFTKNLIRGLLVNEARYGYMACPCRLASGRREDDLDIVCPCDYRDPDLTDYGACYCALYVTQPVLEGKQVLSSIPERRPSRSERRVIREKSGAQKTTFGSLPYPVWRCKVCGYLCARESPPEVCPVCKVKKDRFERFI